MTKKQKSYLGGAVILAAGSMIAKFLGIFFKSPLNGIIGEYGLGLYSYAYPLYGAFISVSTIGLPVAVSKLVSEYAAAGNYKTAYKVYRTAIITLGILGFLATILMFSCANFFIRVFQWEPDAYYSIVAISVAPFFVALTSAYRGFFQGMQAMSYSAVSQIVDQMVRVGVGLALAIYLTNNFGIPEGAAGATFGATAGAAAAFLFLWISFLVFKNKQKPLVKSSENMPSTAYRTILKSLIIIAIPVAFSGLVATIMELINSATIPACLIKAGVEDPTALFGILEQKAQTLINVPLVIGSALSASLVPTISQSLKLNRTKEAVRKTSMAIRASFLIAVPSAVGLSVLSEPIIELLFRNSTPIAYTMLSLLAYNVIFSISMVSLQGILQGAGKFYTALKNVFIGAVVKVALNLVLVPIPSIGIYGAIISTIVASFTIFTLNYFDVKKYVGIENVTWKIIKTFVCAAIMGLICYLVYPALNVFLDFRIAVLITICIAAAVYIGLIVITETFSLNDLKKVRDN